MNTHAVRGLLLVSLMLLSGQAAAVPVMKAITPIINQATDSSVNAGLIVEAATAWPSMAIGAGFTLRCNTSNHEQPVQKKLDYFKLSGLDVVMTVPDPVPSTYPIPDWTQTPAATCGLKICTLIWKVEISDSLSTIWNVSLSGLGANISLNPSGVVYGNSASTPLCRNGTPTCCTQNCQLP